MKRDDERLRHILLEYESEPDWIICEGLSLDSDSDESDRYGHLLLLIDAGLVTNVGRDTFRLTNAGHDYIAAIRQDTIWNKTRNSAAMVGGMTLGMMRDLAIAYLKQEAAAKLGVKF